MLYHFASEHSTQEPLPTIPPQMLVDMHISRAEETWMNIDQANTNRWREQNNILNTDAIEKIADMLVKQDRAASTVVQEPQRKIPRVL